MLIRRVHRNKEGHYARACLTHYKCSCAGSADGLLCSFIPAGIRSPTLPPPGAWGERSSYQCCYFTSVFLPSESWSWGITHQRMKSWRRGRSPKPNLHQVQTHNTPVFHLSPIPTDCECSLFAVEDKVKDQLEAANPEPIIEEVVSTPSLFLCRSTVVVEVAVLSSSPVLGFGQPRPKKTWLVRKNPWCLPR